MKGNKKILVVALLLLLIAVSYSTYAIYKSSATAGNSIKAANWAVSVSDGVNTANIVTSDTFTLTNITCTGTRIGKNNTIAPGDSCTATLTIDASGSEVDVSYAVAVDTSNISNNAISVQAASGSSLTGTISYGSTMTATVNLAITWTATDDATSGGQNEIDIATKGLAIPLTVTVTQNPNPAA